MKNKELDITKTVEEVRKVTRRIRSGVSAYKRIFNFKKKIKISEYKYKLFCESLKTKERNLKLNSIYSYIYDIIYYLDFHSSKNKFDIKPYKIIALNHAPIRPDKTKNRSDVWSKEEILKIRKLPLVNIVKKYIFILCEYCLGTRISETLSIKLKNCKIIGSIVEIKIERGKGNRDRIAFLPYELYLKAKKEFNSKVYLFEYTINNINRPYKPRGIQKWHDQIGQALGKKIHPHILIYSFICDQIEAGTDMITISKITGKSLDRLRRTYYLPDFSPERIMKIQTKGIII